MQQEEHTTCFPFQLEDSLVTRKEKKESKEGREKTGDTTSQVNVGEEKSGVDGNVVIRHNVYY